MKVHPERQESHWFVNVSVLWESPKLLLCTLYLFHVCPSAEGLEPRSFRLSTGQSDAAITLRLTHLYPFLAYNP